jgi:D-alanyl-D-alanine carboxypeptidase/D-alanyl-D-alanine-endopeptidase (penicillin-binding protein 4)
VRAKTGTIRGVKALSGYVTGRGGRRYVFVILANGRSAASARKLQDRVVRILAEAP